MTESHTKKERQKAKPPNILEVCILIEKKDVQNSFSVFVCPPKLQFFLELN